MLCVDDDNGMFTISCYLYTIYVDQDDDDDMYQPPSTIFVPTDTAFNNLNELFGRDITTDQSDLLERIFNFHIIDSKAITYDELICTELYTMISGDTSRTLCEKNNDNGIWEKYQKGGGNRKNNMNPKLLTNNIACNGSIVHTIDNVMLPNFIDKIN